MPLQEDVRFINDDLIGFFNSVPQVRILERVSTLLQQYSQLSSKEYITVCIARGRRETKSIAGRTKSAGDPEYWKHIIQLADLLHIAQSACNCQWKQREGTSIGNQISPILSALPVIATGRGWLTLHNSSRLLPFLPIRYVDNRFIMYSFAKRNLPCCSVHGFTDLLLSLKT